MIMMTTTTVALAKTRERNDHRFHPGSISCKANILDVLQWIYLQVYLLCCHHPHSILRPFYNACMDLMGLSYHSLLLFAAVSCHLFQEIQSGDNFFSLLICSTVFFSFNCLSHLYLIVILSIYNIHPYQYCPLYLAYFIQFLLLFP